MKYAIEDYGIDHEQYFTGAGVAYTEWDDSYVGIGETLREAIDDALEMAAQSGVDVTFVSKSEAARADQTGVTDAPGDIVAHSFTNAQLDAPLHDETDECQADDEMCEHHHYAVLFIASEEGDDA